MLAQLGSTQFEGLFSYHEWEDTGETIYAEVDLIGSKADLQRTGEALDVIVFNIRLHEAYCDPELRYNELKTYRINGEILPFIDGYGTVIGNFVIEKIKRTINQTDPKGRVILCECEVSLKEYVDPNRSLTTNSNARNNAFALSATSLKSSITNPVPSPSADIFKSIQAVSNGSNSIAQSVAAAAANADAQDNYIDQAQRMVNDTMQAVVDTQNKAASYISDVNNATQIGVQAATIATNLTYVTERLAAGDLANAQTGVGILNASVSGLENLSQSASLTLLLR